ncbi:NAD(P)H-dependent oxidoreductase [Paenibacillus sepulcri]|uniref:NAD(P)H-dependent oxidoreductase n=1 Tax=Paenibacillus sepulcri TaxID=359917 RepID=A0ABS7BWM6_9BACL|nr:NAD(P)H-dependent oxidoreductase [Paenibacillus sepulcri]
MKHLIIFSHPQKDSFNHAILQKATEGLRKGGHEVIVRDLYDMGFDPGKNIFEGADDDVLREQEHLIWADVISFIYPIWWTGLPSMMKGYIERVFSYGFAYKYMDGVQKGLLKGKKAVIINTQGKSLAEYEANGMQDALRLTSDKGIFEYCGFEILYHIFFDSVDRSDEPTRKAWLEKVADMTSKA